MPGISTSQMISLLNTTLSAFMRKRFISTQALQAFPAVRTFIETSQRGVTFDSHTFEWVVWMRSNTGSFRPVRYHEAWGPQEGPAPVRASVPIIKYEGKGIMFDRRERAQNASSVSQIVDVVKGKTDAFFKEVFSTLERDLFAVPSSPANSDIELWSLWKWFRPSMNSSGAFVASTTGGFDGTYIRYSDGSTNQATLAGIDASNVNNSQWRNYVATHGGTMTKDLCRSIRRANNYTKFTAYPRKIGETIMGSVSIFMNQTFHEAYLDLINEGPDDRGTGGKSADLFPYQEGTVAGVNILRAPQLDNDATSPIFGVRHDGCYVMRHPEFWFKENGFREMPNAHNSIFAPIDVCGNLVCLSPRESGWVIHGSF